MYDFCIVGAGPTGLTLAYRLAQSGRSVAVIERDSRPGGLAKSFDIAGNIFDIGPKRFHTEDPKVLDFLEEIAGAHLLSIGRSTKVYFLDRYFDWPLSTRDLPRLPIGVSVRCFFELFRRNAETIDDSFRSYIETQYGSTLYETFFAPYTEKFLRIDPENVHADWASTGINRSIVDKPSRGSSLSAVAKSLLLPSKIRSTFLYPSEGGFGGFWNQLFELCQATDRCTFLFSDAIDTLTPVENGLMFVTRNGVQSGAPQMCWTGNLNDLMKILGRGDAVPRLKYLNTIFVYLVLDGAVPREKAQWIYVTDGRMLISRITCTKEFASYTCRPGEYGICCEVTDAQDGSRYWDTADQLPDAVVKELVGMGIIKSSRAVKHIRVHKQADTYPVYHRNYAKDFSAVRREVKRIAPQIALLGRSGAFWYNNSDHSIRMALDFAEHLLDRSRMPLDYRRYFGDTEVSA